jgi:hypothetical protein
MRSPKASTVPCVGWARPARTLSSVDLPEPLAPSMARRGAPGGGRYRAARRPRHRGERLDPGGVLVADAGQAKQDASALARVAGRRGLALGRRVVRGRTPVVGGRAGRRPNGRSGHQ